MTALRALVPVAGGLAVAFAAALVCLALHTPLPWMLGPLVAVAAAQSFRILIVVVTIPSAFAALGLHGADPFVAASSEVRWPALAGLLSMAAVAGMLLARLNVPNAFVLGPLLVTIPLTIGG